MIASLNLYPKYGYANARTKAMKSKLLEESTLNALIAVKSIEEVIEILEEGPYKDELVELSQKYTGVELVNKAMDLNYIRTIQKLSRFIPKGSDELFNLVLEEWTITNIKSLIASKATGVKMTQTLPALNGEQQSVYAIANDETLDLKKTIRRLAVPIYGFSAAFRKINSEYFEKEEPEDFRVIFKELDQYYYDKLGKIAQKQTDYATRSLFLARINFLNTMMVARLKNAGVSKEEIEDNIIKGSTKSRGEARRLNEKETGLDVVEEIVNHYQLNQDIVEQFKETNSLVKLEVELERKMMQKALRVSKVSISFAVMLAYIYLKQQEVSFIQAIAYTTQAGISEEMKELVFPVKSN